MPTPLAVMVLPLSVGCVGVAVPLLNTAIPTSTPLKVLPCSSGEASVITTAGLAQQRPAIHTQDPAPLKLLLAIWLALLPGPKLSNTLLKVIGWAAVPCASSVPLIARVLPCPLSTRPGGMLSCAP